VDRRNPASVGPTAPSRSPKAEDGLLAQFGCFGSAWQVNVEFQPRSIQFVGFFDPTTVNGSTYSGNSFRQTIDAAGTNDPNDDHGYTRTNNSPFRNVRSGFI
jgi:hypothetical protein